MLQIIFFKTRADRTCSDSVLVLFKRTSPSDFWKELTTHIKFKKLFCTWRIHKIYRKILLNGYTYSLLQQTHKKRDTFFKTVLNFQDWFLKISFSTSSCWSFPFAVQHAGPGPVVLPSSPWTWWRRHRHRRPWRRSQRRRQLRMTELCNCHWNKRNKTGSRPVSRLL